MLQQINRASADLRSILTIHAINEPALGVYMLQQINRASADLRSILTIHAQLDTGDRYSNVSQCWYLYIIGFQMAPLYVVC